MKALAALIAVIFLGVTFCQNQAAISANSRPQYTQHTLIPADVIPHSRSSIIRHLLEDGMHRGKFDRASLDLLTDRELFALHSDDHSDAIDWNLFLAATSRTKSSVPAVMTAVSQKVQTTVTIDPLHAASVLIRNAGDKHFSCTGVAVSKTGGQVDIADMRIISVKHGNFGSVVEMWFPTEKSIRRAYKVVEPNEAECPNAFIVEGTGSFQTIQLADAAPAVGEFVKYGGYPRAASVHDFMQGTATMIGGARLEDYPSIWGNMSTNMVINGMSGCALVNQKRQLLGVLHGRKPVGGKVNCIWLRWDAVVRVFNQAIGLKSGVAEPQRFQRKQIPKSARPRIIAFSRKAPVCQPCIQFKRDLADRSVRELDEFRSDILIVELENGKWSHPDIVQRYTATMKEGINAYPTFWIEGTRHTYRDGYAASAAGRNGLCQWIKNFFRSVLMAIRNIFSGEPEPAPNVGPVITPVVPTQEGGGPVLGIEGEIAVPPPVEVTAEEFDWGYLSLVFFAQEDINVTGARGLAREKLLERGRDLIDDRVNVHLGGKAHIFLVPQRTNPKQYEASIAAFGVSPSPFAVGALVKKQMRGLKSIIEGKIIDKARKVLEGVVPPGFPIVVVFEVGDSEKHAACRQALLTQEDESLPIDPVVPPLTGEAGDAVIEDRATLLDGVKSAAKGAALDALQDKLAPLEQKILGAEGDRNFLQRLLVLITGGSALAGGGFGLKTFLANRVKAKALGVGAGLLSKVAGKETTAETTA